MHQPWVPAVNTDIRKTLVANWPEKSRCKVFERMKREVEAKENIPATALMTVHKTPRTEQ